MILAGWGINKMLQEIEEPEPYLYQGGLVTSRDVRMQEIVSPITGQPFYLRK